MTTSDLDPSSDSLPPSPEQPHTEQESEPEVISTDVADMAKRKKYLSFLPLSPPNINFKFPREKPRSF